MALLVVLAACLYAVTYIRGWHDDNTYHIPLAINVAKHFNPYHVDAENTPATGMWFPTGAESLAGLFVLATESINSTNLTGALMCVSLLMLVYKFAGLWTSAPVERTVAVGLAATIPLLLAQCLAFYVDIHLAFVVCLSLYLLCLSVVRGESRFAYYGMAAGLLTASVKHHGILFNLVLLPAAACCVLRCPVRRPSRTAVLLIVACALFSSGWYIRNLALKGNPIYPFSVPHAFRPILAWSGVPYQEFELFPFVSPEASFPHPIVPENFVRFDYRPDMTNDGYGAGFIIAVAFTLLSLTVLGRLTPARRRAWIFLLITTTLLVAINPFGLRIPRYVLFLPVVLALSPAVLHSAMRGPANPGRPLRVLINVAVLLLSGLYVYANLLDAPTARTTLKATWVNLMERNPMSRVRYEYVEAGGLRIGYLSGSNDFVAALYDEDLTNTPIPLHYKNVGTYDGREFDTVEEFIAHVETLRLDYIHIFDRDAPGAEALLQRFPDMIGYAGLP